MASKKIKEKKDEIKEENKKEKNNIDKVKEDKKIEVYEIDVPNFEKKEEKTKSGLIPTIISLIVIISVITLVMSGKININSEERLKNNLTSLGEEYYSNLYYDQLASSEFTRNPSKYLSQFKEIGIKISLNNLEKNMDNKNKKTYKQFEKYGCDKYNTMVSIYPKKPYGKNDFEITSTLDCSKLK